MSNINSDNKNKTQEVYYRRCHVCSYTDCGQTEVLCCSQCGKQFSKFFFCEHFQQFIQTDLKNKFRHGQRKSRPLIGISLIWKTRSI